MKSQYAYSIKTSRVKEPDFPYHGQKLTCTAEVVEFVKSLQSSDVEKMLVIYLDAQNALLCIQVIRGIVNQAVVYPREVLRHGLLVNASGMLLVHNHPSGNLKPSDADIRMTQQIKESAKTLDILVHDHFIIGEHDRYYSFRDAGLM
jgi:DNA repair protein RadC